MKGSITTFLALSLSVLTGFLLFLTGSAVRNAEKICLEGAMDLGMNSVLGEFHTGLHNRYGLLYIDLSYGTGEPALEKLESRLDFFAGRNAKEEKNSPWGEVTIEQVSVNRIASAAFNDGNALKYQAVCYMQDCNHKKKQRGKVWSEISDVGDRDVMAEWSGLMGQIAEIEPPLIQDEKGEWVEVPLDNPADAVFALAGSDLFYLAGIDGNSIGVGMIQPGDYASHRTLQNVQYGETKEADTELFVSYLHEKMGNYGRIRENSFLQYQLEYIIMGRFSDYENLQAVIEKILQWCFARNLEYAMNNDALQSMAFQTAENLRAVSLKEAYKRPVAESMIYAIAYLESLAEVRCIFSGGNITSEKESFYLSWDQMLLACITQIPSFSEGICYEDFLTVLLMQLSEKERNLRSMDIMEMDIRMNDGNPGFAMDFCAERIEAEVKAGSYSLKRTYGYY